MTTKLFSKDFTLVVIGQIISLFGNAILRFALPLYLLKVTRSSALFGLVTALSFLPMIILSFLGGILADRVNKRNIMVCLDFLTAGIIVFLTLTIESVSIVPLFVFVLMMLYGISGTYQPTVQASIPLLVAKENILSAGAVVNQISSLAALLGPIIGGMLFGAYGIMPILVLSIVCFVASAIMELFITIPHTKRKNQESVVQIIIADIKDSLLYMKQDKRILLKIIGVLVVFNFVLSALIIVGTPILIIKTLQMPDELLGITQGALATGGLFGGILTSMLSKRLKLANSHYLLLLCSVSVGIMGVPLMVDAPNMISYLVITAASFIIMGFATMFSIQMLATVQTQTPVELVGKVIALMMSLAMCAQPLGQAFYGVAFDKFANHTGLILLSAAVVSILISISSKKMFKNAD